MKSIEQLTLAHRYLYYVKSEPVISDQEFDELEKLALSVAPTNSLLHNPGSDRHEDYPLQARLMAHWLGK